jgi:hypothetical protein
MQPPWIEGRLRNVDAMPEARTRVRAILIGGAGFGLDLQLSAAVYDDVPIPTAGGVVVPLALVVG